MKKVLYLLLIGVLYSASAQAKYKSDCQTHGGFYDVDATTMSVAEVMGQSDNAFVHLKGKIIKRIGKNMYEFTDGKDNIMLEIDNKIWQNQTVSPKDTVLLYGEVDKERGMTSVDVKSLKLVSQ